MTATPLPRKPTGKLAFAYQTIATLEQARADLEAEIERKDALLRQVLKTLTLHQGAHPAAYRQAIDAITKELQ